MSNGQSTSAFSGGSIAPTPTVYFNGIDYNPLFYQKTTVISLTYASQNYLSRLGSNPTSVATLKVFQEILKQVI